jgi:hypothetical protein
MRHRCIISDVQHRPATTATLPLQAMPCEQGLRGRPRDQRDRPRSDPGARSSSSHRFRSSVASDSIKPRPVYLNLVRSACRRQASFLSCIASAARRSSSASHSVVWVQASLASPQAYASLTAALAHRPQSWC